MQKTTSLLFLRHPHPFSRNSFLCLQRQQQTTRQTATFFLTTVRKKTLLRPHLIRLDWPEQSNILSQYTLSILTASICITSAKSFC